MSEFLSLNEKNSAAAPSATFPAMSFATWISGKKMTKKKNFLKRKIGVLDHGMIQLSQNEAKAHQ